MKSKKIKLNLSKQKTEGKHQFRIAIGIRIISSLQIKLVLVLSIDL